MTIYVDNAGTTCTSQTALDAMMPVFKELYGNASSVHHVGLQAAERLDEAREEIARLIGAKPQEIYFTSGGTEADNWAISSAAMNGARKNKKHIITSAFEHHAVLHTVQALEKQGFEVTFLPVHENGVVRPDELRDAIREDTALVTIMYANNEIGTIQPIAELGAICREKKVAFHTDAVQAVGHIEVNVELDNIDMLSLSAHKFNGPKGVGALYCRTGIPLNVYMHGGAQERGKRGGTENLPAIVGMTAALKEATDNMEANQKKISAMRDDLAAAFGSISHSRHNGAGAPMLPGTLNFCFEGIEGEALLLMLDMHGICASSGSACTSGSLDPSHVLLALGLPHEIAHGSLRISLSHENTAEEMKIIKEKLPGIVAKLRDMSPVWERIEKGENYGIQ